MFQDIDLRALAERHGPERAFLTLYLPDEAAAHGVAERAEHTRRLLADHPDELEHLERSLEQAREVIDKHHFNGKGLAVFSSWALDFCEGYPLQTPKLPTVFRLGSCFYLRPLAELQDEYERFAAVTASNGGAEIWLVSMPRTEKLESIGAEIKNHVKKGGWSQKRYQRRRQEQIAEFVDGVIERLTRLHDQAEFERLVLLGAHDVIARIEEALPERLADLLIGTRQAEVKDAEEAVESHGAEMAAAAEKREEESLWKRIRDDALGEGLAVTGPARVLSALREGRVETVLVDRELERAAVRCRECDTVAAGSPRTCPSCGHADPIEEDLANQLVEQAQLTGARVDFVDPFEELARVGGVAALLRY